MNKSLLFCLMTLALSAQAGTLLPPGAADQSPSRLQAAPAPVGDFERQPVAFAWALDPQAELGPQAPYLAESREYWALADATEMRAGLAIDTTAPGAVIRISPAKGSAAVAPEQVRLLRNGRAIAQSQVFQRSSSGAQLQAAGMDVPDGSAVMQLADDQGKGKFQVQLPQARGQYLVHVYEPESEFVLKAQADRRSVLAGDTLEVAADLQRGNASIKAGEFDGLLISPSGRSYDMTFENGRARMQVPDEAGSVAGLWEIQLSAGGVVDGSGVQRDARTAIEVSRPTARLGNGYGFNASVMRFDLPVQVAAPGRYELRGTLYATGRDGISRPVAQAHVAQWFEPGQGRLGLAFGRGNLPTGYGAPFEVRYLELKDQTRMGTLETRELALREGTAPVATPRPVRPVTPVNPVRPNPVRGVVRQR